MKQGGTPDYILDLRKEGMLSTTELSEQVGIQLSATWIINKLGINPRVIVRQGAARYWSRGQVEEVRLALIAHLAQVGKSR